MKIRILPSALDDLSEGFDFYEQQQSGLGAYFLDSLLADIDSLTIHAGVHRKVHGSHRLLSRTFPFAVYYTMEETTADVKAVLDCRRDPQWALRQLKRR